MPMNTDSVKATIENLEAELARLTKARDAYNVDIAKVSHVLKVAREERFFLEYGLRVGDVTPITAAMRQDAKEFNHYIQPGKEVILHLKIEGEKAKVLDIDFKNRHVHFGEIGGHWNFWVAWDVLG